MMEEVELLETSTVSYVKAPVHGATSHGVYRRALRTKSSVTGSTVSFHGLSYFVDAPVTGAQRRHCCETVPKQILHDVT